MKINKYIKIFFLNLILLTQLRSDLADIIIFSFDRPLQLYALLESIDKYVKGIDKIFIIYRTSSERFNKVYQKVFSDFTKLNIKSYKQGNEPKKDFKPLLINSLNQCNNYLLFAVDDIIIKDFIDINECIKYLENNNYYGFYLRLGKNITECYTEGIKTPLPQIKQLNEQLFAFSFENQKGDWGYPSTVDFTLYKKEKVINIILKNNFTSPNTFESMWAKKLSKKGLIGIAYNESKIINIPANIVQKDYNNKNMKQDLNDFLEKFENGFKIDINKFFKINNKSPHIISSFEFINK